MAALHLQDNYTTSQPSTLQSPFPSLPTVAYLTAGNSTGAKECPADGCLPQEHPSRMAPEYEVECYEGAEYIHARPIYAPLTPVRGRHGGERGGITRYSRASQRRARDELAK